VPLFDGTAGKQITVAACKLRIPSAEESWMSRFAARWSARRCSGFATNYWRCFLNRSADTDQRLQTGVGTPMLVLMFPIVSENAEMFANCDRAAIANPSLTRAPNRSSISSRWSAAPEASSADF